MSLFYSAQKRSGILVLTLLVLALISVIVLGLVASVTAERQSTESNYQQRRALSLAMLGFQSGVAQLRDALGTGTSSWDNPYGNFATNPPSFYWSVSPGMLSRWSYTQAAALTNYPLFSYTTDNNNTALVNLNRPLADGSYPIIGGTGATNVSVQFVNVLQNPAAAAGPDNRIVGRYAFWIDDESAKININVADGSRTKYSDDWLSNSLGVGSPTEESLLVLPQNGGTLDAPTASNVVQIARNGSYHSAREILRASGTTADLYSNNVFDLTDNSRSPDLNVFGQPKMALMPILGDSADGASDMIINGITLQPSTQIYPTPSQLRPYTFTNSTGVATSPALLAFRNMIGGFNSGYIHGGTTGDSFYNTPNYTYANGSVLAQYLAGTNTAYQPVTWPVFPGTSASGYSTKYTQRQLDEIVVQFLNIGGKEISPDYTCSSDSPGWMTPGVALGWAERERLTETPFLFRGWLSSQYVCGTGRGPKLFNVCMLVGTQAAGPMANITGPNGATNVPDPPPQMTIDLWEQFWMPEGFRGGNIVGHDGQIQEGFSQNQYCMNTADLSMNANSALYVSNAPYASGPGPFPWYAASIPKADSSQSWWANQILTNNEGIDFAGNPSRYWDPDQGLANAYHNPRDWAPSLSTNPTDPAYVYWGDAPYSCNWTAGNLSQVFAMNWMQVGQDNPYDPIDWQAGEIRCVRAYMGPMLRDMTESAAGGNLVIGGGFQQRAFIVNDYMSEIDPVPLECIRGGDGGNAYLSGEYWTNVANAPDNPTETVRQRNLASVIPVSVSLGVPGVDDGGPGPSAFVSMSVKGNDPLVNKFPGDWVASGSPPPIIWSAPSEPSTRECWGSDWDTDILRGSQADPDSYWLPEADCGFGTLDDVAAETLIPRSARMPNIGYLNYTRTGIIPDDEVSTPYEQQHGTPFRLLSFGPAGDAASQSVHNVTYPDWAMLDLLYVPSILNSYGGPWSSYKNATYTNLASFGTYGGATSGRINPNGSVIYTTNTTTPSVVVRTLPLQATLYGLHVNQTMSGTTNATTWAYTDTSGSTVMDAATSATLASNIAYFISTNGPLRVPAEICDIPQVAGLRASVNLTRNDLVRQMVGELTTQSNVFSVWTVGQVIQKARGNTGYSEFEAGDQILGEVRLHLIVERYLDPGSDGVYGNAAAGEAGTDGIVGTFDDPENNATHPFQPKYLYRVVRSEEVR